MSSDAHQIALSGAKLSDAKAAALEEELKRNPGLLETRFKLLGYFSRHRFMRPEIRPKYVEAAIWFIENRPDDNFTGSYCGVLDTDGGYDRAGEAWERMLEKPDVVPEILLNAARFYAIQKPERAREILERGEQRWPQRADWAGRLGRDLLRTVIVQRMLEDAGREPRLSFDRLKDAASRSLAHLERALSLLPKPEDRFEILPNLAIAALEAGKGAEAFRYAEETLSVAALCPKESHRADLVHEAHIVRGRVLLNQGDLDAACRELEAAGRQGLGHAPVLHSFGPDFRLARLLLERGRKEAVLSYLDCCGRFWEQGRIAKWRAEIERGGCPRMFTGYDPSDGPQGSATT